LPSVIREKAHLSNPADAKKLARLEEPFVYAGEHQTRRAQFDDNEDI
jgi:hypothetical protein